MISPFNSGWALSFSTIWKLVSPSASVTLCSIDLPSTRISSTDRMVAYLRNSYSPAFRLPAPFKYIK